jgi:hypothetical protein
MSKPNRIKNREQDYQVDTTACTVTHVPTGTLWAVAPARSASDLVGARPRRIAMLASTVQDRRADDQIGDHPAQARGVTAWVLTVASGSAPVLPEQDRHACTAWLYRARLDRERPRPSPTNP